MKNLSRRAYIIDVGNFGRDTVDSQDGADVDWSIHTCESGYYQTAISLESGLIYAWISAGLYINPLKRYAGVEGYSIAEFLVTRAINKVYILESKTL